MATPRVKRPAPKVPEHEPTPETARDDDTWVTLAEASRLVGCSVAALRKWYADGDIPSRLERGPHGQQRLVPVSAVQQRYGRSVASPGLRSTRRTPTEDDSTLVISVAAWNDLTNRYEAALDRAVRAEAALVELRRRLEQLRG